MTPAQLELLRGLTREDLLAVVADLVIWADDHAVIRAVMSAAVKRSDRLGSAWLAASQAEAAAFGAWIKKPENRRLHRAYLDAQDTERRARAAADRAHAEFNRIAALPCPLPAPRAAASSRHPETAS